MNSAPPLLLPLKVPPPALEPEPPPPEPLLLLLLLLLLLEVVVGCSGGAVLVEGLLGGQRPAPTLAAALRAGLLASRLSPRCVERPVRH